MAGIWRKGFYFDCGDQSTEDVGILFPILKELGLYAPEDWIRARFRFVTPDCDVMMYDYDQMRDDFKKAFPGSKAQLDKWFDFIKPQCESMAKMMGEGAFNMLLDGKEKVRANLRSLVNSACHGHHGHEDDDHDRGREGPRVFPGRSPPVLPVRGEWCRKHAPHDAHDLLAHLCQ